MGGLERKGERGRVHSPILIGRASELPAAVVERGAGCWMQKLRKDVGK